MIFAATRAKFATAVYACLVDPLPLLIWFERVLMDDDAVAIDCRDWVCDAIGLVLMDDDAVAVECRDWVCDAIVLDSRAGGCKPYPMRQSRPGQCNTQPDAHMTIVSQ